VAQVSDDDIRTPSVLLDDVSMQIIRELQRDGRRPYTSIAKTVGLSEAAVRQRVQRLLDSGVMQIVAVTDPLRVGLHRDGEAYYVVGADSLSAIRGNSGARQRTWVGELGNISRTQDECVGLCRVGLDLVRKDAVADSLSCG
jgi:DNA-binding Lrp family transcriptional regulator